MTTCVCCANQDLYIKVIDGNDNKVIPGIQVTVGAYTETTNDKGIARVQYMCESLNFALNNHNAWLHDPKERFADVSLRLSKVNECNYEVKVHVPHKKVQIVRDAKVVNKNIKDNAKKGYIPFYKVCDTKITRPTGVTGNCVKIFEDVDTQFEPGVALAKEFVKKNYNKEIKCDTTFRKVNNLDYYLACTTTDGKNAFEFVFDDLTESFDNTIRTGTVTGLCAIYGGKMSYAEGRKFCFKDKFDQTQELCNQLKKVSSRFPISAEVVGSLNRCYIDFKQKRANDAISTYGSLDPFVFQKYQMKFDSSIKVLIGQYVESKLGSDFRSLTCASMAKPYKVSLGTDDIVECTLRVYSETVAYKIEFVFDDLSEWSDTDSQGDKSKMTCLVNDGTYVAGQCVGVSAKQCEEIRREFGVSTQFNQEMQTCELIDAQHQENVHALVERLAAFGFFAATIATGGTVLVVASSGIAIATAETKNILQNRAASRGIDILNQIKQCGCNTQCNADGCNICNACNSQSCNVDAIYDAIPFTVVYTEAKMGGLIDESIKSIEDSCMKNEEYRLKKINKLKTDMQWMQVSETLLDTATVLSSIGSLKPTSQALKAIQGIKNVKVVDKSGKIVERAISAGGDLNTYLGVLPSDSTSTNQPPNQKKGK